MTLEFIFSIIIGGIILIICILIYILLPTEQNRDKYRMFFDGDDDSDRNAD